MELREELLCVRLCVCICICVHSVSSLRGRAKNGTEEAVECVFVCASVSTFCLITKTWSGEWS